MPTRTRIGRPPEILDRVEIVVYLRRAERTAIRRAARQAQVSTSAWVRAAALAALRNPTGRTAVALLAGLLAWGCGPTALPLPRVPNVQTPEGGQCVRECQALYNQCTSPIPSSGVGFARLDTKARATEARNGCTENLAGCYGTCR